MEAVAQKGRICMKRRAGNRKIRYLLHADNTWQYERDFSASFLPLVERYLKYDSKVEVIKLEEMEEITYTGIPNGKETTHSSLVKLDDSVVQCSAENQIDIHCKKQELKETLQTFSGCGNTITFTGIVKKTITSDICCKSFSCQGNLKTDKVTHSIEKPFCCDICGKLFIQRGNLNKHKVIHTGEKSFSCNICEKLFRRKGDLKRHKLTHSGEKPFSCNICEKSLTQKCKLNKQKLNHSG